jgi:hypothetical protein
VKGTSPPCEFECDSKSVASILIDLSVGSSGTRFADWLHVSGPTEGPRPCLGFDVSELFAGGWRIDRTVLIWESAYEVLDAPSYVSQ